MRESHHEAMALDVEGETCQVILGGQVFLPKRIALGTRVGENGYLHQFARWSKSRRAHDYCVLAVVLMMIPAREAKRFIKLFFMLCKVEFCCL